MTGPVPTPNDQQASARTDPHLLPHMPRQTNPPDTWPSQQPSTEPARARSRAPWVLIGTLGTLAAILVAGVALSAVREHAGTAPASTPAAPATTTAPPRNEAAYLTTVRNGGVNPAATDAALVTAGDAICSAIGEPGVTRAHILATVAATGQGSALAEVLVGAAERHLCPQKRYTAAPAAAPAPQSVAPAGPQTSFTDGTFIVGTDIEPGTYRTGGPYARAVPNCYWARLKGTSGDMGEILANGNTNGPATVTIKPGDAAFRSNGCATWTKAK